MFPKIKDYLPIAVMAKSLVMEGMRFKLNDASNMFRQEDAIRIRIYAGLDANPDFADESNLKGSFPRIHLYDEYGDKVGSAMADGTLQSGAHQDFYIYPKKGMQNSRAQYIRFHASGWDALCIAGVHIVYPDEGDAFFSGDIPVLKCGWAGYHSTITDFKTQEGIVHRPKCFWLDSDNTEGSEYWKLGSYLPNHVWFHIPDFHLRDDAKAAYNNDQELLCGSSPRMSCGGPIKEGGDPKYSPYFEPPLIYNLNNTKTDLDGRAIRPNFLDKQVVYDVYEGSGTKRNRRWARTDMPRYPWFDGVENMNDEDEDMRELYEHHNRQRKRGSINATEQEEVRRQRRPRQPSLKEQHSTHFIKTASEDEGMLAEWTCKQTNFHGPSWANEREGKFCDMQERKVWRICEEGGDSGGAKEMANCFDLKAEELLGEVEKEEGVEEDEDEEGRWKKEKNRGRRGVEESTVRRGRVLRKMTRRTDVD